MTSPWDQSGVDVEDDQAFGAPPAAVLDTSTCPAATVGLIPGSGPTHPGGTETRVLGRGDRVALEMPRMKSMLTRRVRPLSRPPALNARRRHEMVGGRLPNDWQIVAALDGDVCTHSVDGGRDVVAQRVPSATSSTTPAHTQRDGPRSIPLFDADGA